MAKGKTVSMYNPFLDAFCEMPLDKAVKLIEVADKMRDQVEALQAEEKGKK